MFANVYITVGTTEFNELLEVVAQEAFIQVLASKGCESLTVQYGLRFLPFLNVYKVCLKLIFKKL